MEFHISDMRFASSSWLDIPLLELSREINREFPCAALYVHSSRLACEVRWLFFRNENDRYENDENDTNEPRNMTTRDQHPLSIWLHEFKTVWLPAEIGNDAGLLHSISNKLGELERLIPNADHDEEYYRAKLLQDHSSSNSDTEHVIVTATCPTAHQLSLSGGSLPTPPEVPHSFEDENDDDEQRAKLLLLEQSDDDDDDHIDLFHPSIQLPRMPREESEPYLPVGWTTVESPVHSQFTSSSTSEDECTIRKRLKKPVRHATTSASRTQIRRRATHTSHTPNDIFINFDPPSLPEPLSLADDVDDDNDVDSLDNQEIFQELVDNEDDAESILDFLNLTSETATIPPTTHADPTIDASSTDEDSLDERYCMFIREIPTLNLFHTLSILDRQPKCPRMRICLIIPNRSLPIRTVAPVSTKDILVHARSERPPTLRSRQ